MNKALCDMYMTLCDMNVILCDIISRDKSLYHMTGSLVMRSLVAKFIQYGKRLETT